MGNGNNKIEVGRVVKIGGLNWTVVGIGDDGKFNLRGLTRSGPDDNSSEYLGGEKIVRPDQIGELTARILTPEQLEIMRQRGEVLKLSSKRETHW